MCWMLSHVITNTKPNSLLHFPLLADDGLLNVSFFSLTVTLILFPESFLVIKVAHLSSPLVSAVTQPVTEVLLWTERWLDQGQAGREHLCCAIPPTCLITLSRQGDLVNCLIWRLKYYAANVLCYSHFWVLLWIHGLRTIDFLLHLTFAWASLIFDARVYLDNRCFFFCCFF